MSFNFSCGSSSYISGLCGVMHGSCDYKIVDFELVVGALNKIGYG